MKQLIILVCLISFNLTQAFQAPIDVNIGHITGVVMDKDLQEPLPYVTIIVNDLNGKLISGNITQEDGTFNIEDIPAGTFIFQAQFIGYKTFSKQIEISKSNPEMKFGSIQLEADVSQLEDVLVVAERSSIEQKIDRKVINVGKDLTTSGATASDIMGNMPTLTVDQDGNISMRGNSNVRILIDGKPTNIPAAQLLKQIPSTSIKSVELITNPSAKYNPEGMSGIINIILHKNSNLGFNGNLNTGVTIGKDLRTNGSLDMNYRTGKFNFYGNLGGNFGKRQNGGNIFTYDNQSLQTIKVLEDRDNYLIKAGVDFYVDDQNTLSFYTNQNKTNADIIGDFNILFNPDPSLNIYQTIFLNNDNNSGTYNFDYKRNFKKDGHSIELEADYNKVTSEEITQTEFTGDTSNFSNYTDGTSQEIDNTTINLDYINPLNNKTKLELGAEVRIRNSKNDYNTNNLNLNDALYNYDNNIYSFYATYGQTFEKWSYQLGTRLEQYNVDASLNSEKVYKDDYLTLYPTAFISYQLSEKKSMQLSYGRRVDRPSLNQVSPIRDFSTPRITALGNPELEPQFTNSMEFNYSQNFEKGNFTGGAFYRIINNEINQTLLEDPEDPARQVLTFINGENNSSFGVELTGSYKPLKWWNINSSVELYSQNSKGIIGGKSLEVQNTAFNFRVNNSFTVTEHLTLQAFGYYRSPSKDYQFNANEMYFVNAGARYTLLNDKATLSLNFNDIFKTQKFGFDTEVPSKQSGSFSGDTRTVFVGFSYKFGGGKNAALKRKNREDNESSGGGLF